MAKDFYEALGISKSASADDIKRAYRKLALQYHPDRNKTKEADGKFKEVTKAYEVLSDPQKKQTYDQIGHSSYEQSGGGQGPFGGAGGPFGGAQGGQYGPFTYSYSTGGGNQDFDFGGSDPFEIFEQFFGGGSPFGQRAQRRPVYSLAIDFMEAVKGVEKKVAIDGKSQTVKIPKGVDNGTRIRFDNYDIVVDVRESTRFKREGTNVITDEEVSFAKAAIGTTIKVETVQGIVELKIPSGTQPDTVIRLRGKGIPHLRCSGFGDHYVRIKVVVPKHLNSEQKKILEEFELSAGKKGWF